MSIKTKKVTVEKTLYIAEDGSSHSSEYLAINRNKKIENDKAKELVNEKFSIIDDSALFRPVVNIKSIISKQDINHIYFDDYNGCIIDALVNKSPGKYVLHIECDFEGDYDLDNIFTLEDYIDKLVKINNDN